MNNDGETFEITWLFPSTRLECLFDVQRMFEHFQLQRNRKNVFGALLQLVDSVGSYKLLEVDVFLYVTVIIQTAEKSKNNEI